MSNTRPLYPAAFREQTVELVRSGRSPEELAREFEPSAQAIRNWVAQADRDEGRRADGLTSAEREELRRLKRENRQLRQGREVLAKATALRGAAPADWWAQPPPTKPEACVQGSPDACSPRVLATPHRQRRPAGSQHHPEHHESAERHQQVVRAPPREGFGGGR